MALRNISEKIVLSVIKHPDKILTQEGKTIYQAIVIFKEGEGHLVRVFVNNDISPKVIITVYRTSKLEKYYES